MYMEPDSTLVRVTADDASIITSALGTELRRLRDEVRRLTPKAHKGSYERRIWEASIARAKVLDKTINAIHGGFGGYDDDGPSYGRGDREYFGADA